MCRSLTSPLPLLAIIISGPLTAIPTGAHRALIIEAHKLAHQRGLCPTSVHVDAGGRMAHFAVFASTASAEREERPWCGEVRWLEEELERLRESQPLTALEWAVVIYGQGASMPEHVRGSYVHHSAKP